MKEYRVFYRGDMIAEGTHDYCVGFCAGLLRESPWRALTIKTISGVRTWASHQNSQDCLLASVDSCDRCDPCRRHP